MALQQSGIVDVTIVNWNSGDDLRCCLESLAVETEAALIAGVTIVDNGSIDGSDAVPVPQVLRDRTRIDRAGRNLGFGAAANRGVKQGLAPYLLFLNPDAALHPGALAAGLRAFRQPDISSPIGIVGLRLVDRAGTTSRTCSPLPTPLAFCVRAFGIDLLPGFAAFSPFLRSWPHDRSQIVAQVMGACFLMPRALFSTLDGFDERFFLYYEDVDLARRARAAGHVSWYEIGGAAMHRGGGSSRQIPALRLAYSLSSRLTYAEKHFSLGGRLAVLAATLLIEPWTRLAIGLRRSGLPGAHAVLGGYRLLWRQLRSRS